MWQFPFAEHCLGGPGSEINGLSDSMAGIGAEHNGVAALRMMFENRLPFFRDADGSAPATRELHVLKRRVEFADPFLKPIKDRLYFAFLNVQGMQLAPVIEVNQSAAENHRVSE